MEFQVTPEAEEAISEMIAQEEADSLRIGIKGGACAGFRYHLELWNGDPSPQDFVFGSKVRILIDPKSMVYLQGTVLGWKDEKFEKRLVFDNPNSVSSCGCNMSFDIK